MRLFTILTVAIISLSYSAFADDATQADWSGGDGVTGPVTDWDNTFDISTDSICSGMPGEFRLDYSPVKYMVDDDIGGGYSVCSEDIDDDGDMDIIGVSFHGETITWYENNGSGGGWNAHLIGNGFEGAISVHSADVDGDGDMDVLGAAVQDDDISWWENKNGAGTDWAEHIVSSNYNGWSVYSADIDGDGDTDILGASGDADDITWWENKNGIGTSWTKRAVDDDFNGAICVYSVDMDDDGDMDVLGAGSWADDITWWENNGSGGGWVEHLVDGNFDAARYVFSSDLDGDGDMDVLGAALFGNEITWWENDNGSGTSWVEHIIDDSFNGAICVYSADVDGDGDMDIIGAAGNEDVVAWWENDGIGGGWAEHIVDSNINHPYSVYAADVDGDGKLDILGSSTVDDDIVWWKVNEFNANGNLTSSIYDTEVDTGTTELEWGPVNWTDDIPTDTSLTVEVRASNDSGSMGSWVAVGSSGDDLSNYINDDTRYFQYKVSLTSTDTSASPVFEEITINWNPVGIDDDEGNLPTTFALHPVAPNPSSGTATISFALPHTSEVDLSLYDIKGRKIVTLASGHYQPGEYSATVSGLSSGVYIYSINADEFSSMEKMVVK